MNVRVEPLLLGVPKMGQPLLFLLMHPLLDGVGVLVPCCLSISVGLDETQLDANIPEDEPCAPP